MNKNIYIPIAVASVLAIIGLFWWMSQQPPGLVTNDPTPISTSTSDPTTTPNDEVSAPAQNPDIRVDSIKSGDSVKNPLIITGQARGTWFFEASFPIDVVDKDGKVIAQGHAEAQSDWMTENFVPFKATINFKVNITQAGEIVLKKDNPSGLPEHDKEIRIPVTLMTTNNP